MCNCCLDYVQEEEVPFDTVTRVCILFWVLLVVRFGPTLTKRLEGLNLTIKTILCFSQYYITFPHYIDKKHLKSGVTFLSKGICGASSLYQVCKAIWLFISRSHRNNTPSAAGKCLRLPTLTKCLITLCERDRKHSWDVCAQLHQFILTELFTWIL